MQIVKTCYRLLPDNERVERTWVNKFVPNFYDEPIWKLTVRMKEKDNFSTKIDVAYAFQIGLWLWHQKTLKSLE